ncbi:malto-oligosyltrehalose synthase, partial [Xanthomonas sp. Kuri4-2]
MIDLRATARLQLHAGFTLDDAAAQVDYYAALGVSHLYLSPIGTAVLGSTHGYDNVDPTTVNPELGGEAALQRLSAAARTHGLGLILDIVPNHMATHPSNAWWWDVLRNGRRSRHADWFDIDWRAPGRDGKLWLPVLGGAYAQA